MPDFEDGLRSALSDAADGFSPSPAMVERIEAAVTGRARRKRRVVAGGAAAVALSLSLGVAGATLMSDTGDGGPTEIASPKTTPDTTPEVSPPDTTSTDPPSASAAPAVPAPGAPGAPGAACPPPTSGTGNANSRRVASSSSAATHDAVAQLATPAAYLVATGNSTGNDSGNGSGSSSTITTGDATSGSTSNTTTNQTNTGGSTTNNNHSPPPSTPPPPPPLPVEPPDPNVPVQPEGQAPYSSGANGQGADTAPQGPPAAC